MAKGKRKLFTETSPSGEKRPVLRTHVCHYFGIEEIAAALIDRSFTLENSGKALEVSRKAALQMTKEFLFDRGVAYLDSVGLDEMAGGIVRYIGEDEVSIPAFVGAVLLHVKKIFPELV
jgi:hypothetical protein